MKRGILIIGIIAISVVTYFLITMGVPFDREDLTLDYYNAMAIVKAILALGDLVAIAIIISRKD